MRAALVLVLAVSAAQALSQLRKPGLQHSNKRGYQCDLDGDVSLGAVAVDQWERYDGLPCWRRA